MAVLSYRVAKELPLDAEDRISCNLCEIMSKVTHELIDKMVSEVETFVFSY
jgi:hypothetical protein